MEINLTKLQESSIKFDKKLRLPLTTLSINIGEKRKNFISFISDVIEIESGRKFRTSLSEILIDTGNEAEYIVMSAYYLNTFKERIENISVEKHILEDFRGNKKITEVSMDTFEFTFFNATFKSKIGFTYQTSINALDIINIGINSMRQFLNIFFPIGPENYYFCDNLSKEHSLR